MLTSRSGRLDASAAQLDAYLNDMAHGDRDAFAALYQATCGSVYGFALSILKNSQDAQDVLQDCYLQVYGAAPRYRSQGKPLAWMLTITRHLCMRYLRGRSQNVSLEDEEWEPYLQQNAGLSAEDRVAVSLCMRTLGDEERQIVVLHAVGGLKHREIASLLELPLGTVLSKYRRAIQKLKDAWEGESNV